jgi:hypothetical protein
MENLTMSDQSSIITIYKSRRAADSAVRKLQKSDFDMEKLSVIVKDHRTDEDIVGNDYRGDRMMFLEEPGAFSGGLSDILFRSRSFIVPGVGPLLVAGPLVTRISDVLEHAVVENGFSTFGAALINIGIPMDCVLLYEENLRAGRLLLVLHGTPWEVECAMQRWDCSQATETAVYAEPVTVCV